MTRIVKQYDVRRKEILDSAQRLFYSKGYQQTSIQDITNDIRIAKGTFYHYFESKLDLLDALIERMTGEILQTTEPIVADDRLGALEKFSRFFTHIQTWKRERKKFLIDILPVWYHDDNALFRHKLTVESTRTVVPMLANIVRQGIAEGVFVDDCAEDLSEMVLFASQSISETLGEMLLIGNYDVHTLVLIERKLGVYGRAIERLLGAPENSLELFDFDSIRVWFTD
jgi:AcrR family transcriptional regulator